MMAPGSLMWLICYGVRLVQRDMPAGIVSVGLLLSGGCQAVGLHFEGKQFWQIQSPSGEVLASESSGVQVGSAVAVWVVYIVAAADIELKG